MAVVIELAVVGEMLVCAKTDGRKTATTSSKRSTKMGSEPRDMMASIFSTRTGCVNKEVNSFVSSSGSSP